MTHKFTRFMTFAACLGVASVLPLGAETLNELLGVAEGSADSLTVDGVNFYNFGFSATCTANGVGVACSALGTAVQGTDPSGITVNPETIGGEGGFQLQGPIEVLSPTTGPYAGDNIALDIALTYDASVVGSGVISDVALTGADSRNPTGAANPPSISVGETVDNLGTLAFLGSLQIQDPPADLSDVINLSSSVPSIYVSKDILLESGAGTSGGSSDYADLTTISQLVSTTPEPRTDALMLLGFFGAIAAFKIRRRQIV